MSSTSAPILFFLHGTIHEFAYHPCAGAMLIFSVSFHFFFFLIYVLPKGALCSNSWYSSLILLTSHSASPSSCSHFCHVSAYSHMVCHYYHSLAYTFFVDPLFLATLVEIQLCLHQVVRCHWRKYTHLNSFPFKFQTLILSRLFVLAGNSASSRVLQFSKTTVAHLSFYTFLPSPPSQLMTLFAWSRLALNFPFLDWVKPSLSTYSVYDIPFCL